MRELDGELGNRRNRRIGCVKILFADATYHKVRVDGVVVLTATFIVTGVLKDGHRSILAVDSDQSENEVLWRRVLKGLNDRGMHASLLRLVSAICVEISDEWEMNNYRYMSTIKEL